jgi:hypothetical protein
VDFIDVMEAAIPGPSRWDRGDGESAIRTLDAALAKAGVTGALVGAFRSLDRAEAVLAASRREQDRARQRLEEVSRRLLESDGDIDLAGYGRVLSESAGWIGEHPEAAIRVGDVARQIRARATANVFAQAIDLHRRLSDRAQLIVERIAAVPAPPREVWSTQSSADASGLLIRAGREADWAEFVRAGDEWDAVHAAGLLLRETGVFQTELMFDGPTALCLTFLNWQPAVDGIREVRALPGPLRVRAAIDRGWKPGLWLAADHKAAAEQKPPRRGLFAGLAGR